jgi:hypothetical protein
MSVVLFAPNQIHPDFAARTAGDLKKPDLEHNLLRRGDLHRVHDAAAFGDHCLAVIGVIFLTTTLAALSRTDAAWGVEQTTHAQVHTLSIEEQIGQCSIMPPVSRRR